jgi:hypothetical protein
MASKYQPLVAAIDKTVAVAHACGLPHIAGQLHSVRDVTDETALNRLEDRLTTVAQLLRLRPLPKKQVARFGDAAQILALAVKDARYI